jgi:hypothetical protein
VTRENGAPKWSILELLRAISLQVYLGGSSLPDSASSDVRKIKTSQASKSERCATRKFLRRALRYRGKVGHPPEIVGLVKDKIVLN